MGARLGWPVVAVLCGLGLGGPAAAQDESAPSALPVRGYAGGDLGLTVGAGGGIGSSGALEVGIGIPAVELGLSARYSGILGVAAAPVLALYAPGWTVSPRVAVGGGAALPFRAGHGGVAAYALGSVEVRVPIADGVMVGPKITLTWALRNGPSAEFVDEAHGHAGMAVTAVLPGQR